jgi:hypothetical protein
MTRRNKSSLRAIASAAFFSLLFSSFAAIAEPYLAVRQGLPCSGCHVNPTGGGLRNAAGNTFAQNELAAQNVKAGETPWLGEVTPFVALGGDFRGSATVTDFPDGEDEDLAFATDELRAYLDIRVIPERLSVYFDQKLAPDGSTNREAYARLWLDESKRYYVKAGQMYLPFGHRLEDDTAFIRQVSGINFDTPDNGVEAGFATGPWNAQLALSNGEAGGAESGSGKQWSLRGEYVQSIWRLGASYNFNDDEEAERHLAGLHAGLRTGPVAWLAEVDYVEDRLADGGETRWVGLVEANWMWRRGHNLKITAETFEPDTDIDDDEQDRYSLIYEYFPFQFLQLRGGIRLYDDIAGDDVLNRRFGFIELHAYF